MPDEPKPSQWTLVSLDSLRDQELRLVRDIIVEFIRNTGYEPTVEQIRAAYRKPGL